MSLRFLLFALLACAFLPQFSAAYSDIALNVNIIVSTSGSAHVVEVVHFSMNTPQELEAFDYNVQQAKTTLADWSKFSPSRNVRYHVKGVTSPENLTINAKRDYTIGYSAGQVILEYDIGKLSPSSSIGRIVTHDVNSQNLDFEGNTQETSLGKDTTLVIDFPADAVITRIFPKEDDRKGNTLTWKGPQKAQWMVGYETEQPLGEEASQFFLDLYKQLISLTPFAIVIAVAGFVAFKYYQSKKR